MTLALIAFHRTFLGELMEPVGFWMMRRLAGDRVCDIVGIPYSTLAGVRASFEALRRPADRWSEYVLGRGRISVNDELILTGVPILPKSELPASMRGIFARLPD